MNNNSKILVVICHYNDSEYLEQSVRSIMEQTYEDLDICIVEDFSDNNNNEAAFEIINRLMSEDDRIRFIANDKNYGKWYCLNEAIRTTDAVICTSHDADDVASPHRIFRQFQAMQQTGTVHNLCGFHHCWNEEEVATHLTMEMEASDTLKIIPPEQVYQLVMAGYDHPNIGHYYTGDFETAGTTAMFYKELWDRGMRFNPPRMGMRIIISEDSDFNFRMTALFQNTSILAEKPYCYRRFTSTNVEEL